MKGKCKIIVLACYITEYFPFINHEKSHNHMTILLRQPHEFLKPIFHKVLIYLLIFPAVSMELTFQLEKTGNEYFGNTITGKLEVITACGVNI